MNPAILPEYVAAIAAVRPDLQGLPMVLHARGWDSNAVEVGGTIFKFPKRDEAVERLQREAGFLAFVRPRVPLALPDMVLHEEPMLFSEHRMILGSIIERAGYDALSEAAKQAMADKLAGFYAALHAIAVPEAVAVGAEPKPEWPQAEQVLPLLADRLQARHLDFAARAFVAYAALPQEEQIFGYFDGHGWNMAFDHGAGLLNGVYDFADAAIGPVSRDFTYSNLTAPDLTERMLPAYERLSGRRIDPRTVALRTSVQHLSELAELDDGVDPFARTVGGWIDYAQARPELRL